MFTFDVNKRKYYYYRCLSESFDAAIQMLSAKDQISAQTDKVREKKCWIKVNYHC